MAVAFLVELIVHGIGCPAETTLSCCRMPTVPVPKRVEQCNNNYTIQPSYWDTVTMVAMGYASDKQKCWAWSRQRRLYLQCIFHFGPGSVHLFDSCALAIGWPPDACKDVLLCVTCVCDVNVLR